MYYRNDRCEFLYMTPENYKIVSDWSTQKDSFDERDVLFNVRSNEIFYNTNISIFFSIISQNGLTKIINHFIQNI